MLEMMKTEPSIHKLAPVEVAKILRRVGDGEIIPKLVGDSWDTVYCGDVEYLVDGWKITIFNDCNSWDYIDSAESPDGRRGEFEDWVHDPESDGPEWHQPDALLDGDCYERMVKAFTSVI